MSRIFFIMLVVFLGVASGASQAMLPDAKLHSMVLKGIDLTWREDYAGADSLFRRVTKEYPDHPAGYVYQAGVMLSKAMDNEMEVDVPRFDSLIALGTQKANAFLTSGNDPTWGYFFLGTAEGSDSYARVYRGDWFGGTRKGFASVSSFKDAAKSDSTLCDVYAGIGAFYYWRSRKTEIFNWIPFVGDDRSEAFVLLERVAEKGIYNRYTALSMLVAIYTDAEMYDKAIVCSREGLKRYPANRTFMWGLATACQKYERWTEAKATYRQLLEVIVRSPGNNHYNEIVCRLNLAKVEAALHDTTEVRKLLNNILGFHELDFPKHLQGRAREKIEQAEEMLRTFARIESPSAKQ